MTYLGCLNVPLWRSEPLTTFTVLIHSWARVQYRWNLFSCNFPCWDDIVMVWPTGMAFTARPGLLSNAQVRVPKLTMPCSKCFLAGEFLGMSQTPCLGLRRSATANVQSLYQSWETVGRTGVERTCWSSQPAGSGDAGRGAERWEVAGLGILKSHKTEGAAKLKV